ncbi:MAG: heavy-metal-associated domain-containing protein [Epsilonproteobacteria bacterium]|nr:heavy-metal-associated domain-containing protein [Campylobacterota bacterium]
MKFAFLILTILTLSFSKVAIIKVEGMTCPLCTMAVKKSLKQIDGVTKAVVKLNTKKATVYFDKKIDKKEFLNAIKKAGYSGTIESIK